MSVVEGEFLQSPLPCPLFTLMFAAIGTRPDIATATSMLVKWNEYWWWWCWNDDWCWWWTVDDWWWWVVPMDRRFLGWMMTDA